MHLAAGTRLGPYEVVSPGDAREAETYRAKDTRLNREVAIRILPFGFADTAAKRARLERMTRDLAQLNHPNIRGLIDVGEHNGISFLVMEQVDGESLDARLRTGPLPWRTALTVAVQIAGALDAAHKAGILHRGLAPANVVLVDSAVKLIDFGIAPLTEWTADGAPRGANVTGEHPLGGALNYIAPEQLEGREVDARADIFALGAVLYEMLTGRKAFDGESAAMVTTAVMTTRPNAIGDRAKDGARFPAALNHIVQRALATRREDRWQTSRDLRHELQWLLDSSARAAASASTMPWRRLAWLGLAAVMLLATGVVVGRVAWLKRAAASPVSLVTFTINPPDGTEFGRTEDIVAISPNGKTIAFVATENGKSSLWLKDLNQADVRQILNTEGAEAPFWSPDSQSIGFFVDGRTGIRPGRILGGPSKRFGEQKIEWQPAPGTTACWLPDNKIVFTRGSALVGAPASGGLGQPVASPDASRGEDLAIAPSPLGGGSFFYLVRRTGAIPEYEGRIGAIGRAPKPLPSVRSNAVFAGGYLIFRQGDALVAQRFDERALALLGEPVVLARHVAYDTATAQTAFAASDDVLAYRESGPGEKGITVVLNWLARVR